MNKKVNIGGNKKMEYVYLVVSIFAITIIAYTSIKEIRRQNKSIWLKEKTIQEKAKHEKYLQEVIDQLVKDKRNLKKKIEEYRKIMSIDYSKFALPKPTKNKKDTVKIRNKSSKLTKLEKNRFSIITENLDKCYFCNNRKMEFHEAFRGRNRQKSMKWGLVVPICQKCHTKITKDKEFSKILEQKARNIFVKKYGKEKFIEEFK